MVSLNASVEAKLYKDITQQSLCKWAIIFSRYERSGVLKVSGSKLKGRKLNLKLRQKTSFYSRIIHHRSSPITHHPPHSQKHGKNKKTLDWKALPLEWQQLVVLPLPPHNAWLMAHVVADWLTIKLGIGISSLVQPLVVVKVSVADCLINWIYSTDIASLDTSNLWKWGAQGKVHFLSSHCVRWCIYQLHLQDQRIYAYHLWRGAQHRSTASVKSFSHYRRVMTRNIAKTVESTWILTIPGIQRRAQLFQLIGKSLRLALN